MKAVLLLSLLTPTLQSEGASGSKSYYLNPSGWVQYGYFEQKDISTDGRGIRLNLGLFGWRHLDGGWSFDRDLLSSQDLEKE